MNANIRVYNYLLNINVCKYFQTVFIVNVRYLEEILN